MFKKMFTDRWYYHGTSTIKVQIKRLHIQALRYMITHLEHEYKDLEIQNLCDPCPMFNPQIDQLYCFCNYRLILNVMPATCFKNVWTGAFLPLWYISFLVCLFWKWNSCLIYDFRSSTVCGICWHILCFIIHHTFWALDQHPFLSWHFLAAISRDVSEKEVIWMAAYVAPKHVSTFQFKQSSQMWQLPMMLWFVAVHLRWTHTQKVCSVSG